MLLVAFIFQSVGSVCHSQNLSIHDSVKESMYRIPYDLNPQEWDKVQKMWSRNSHPVKVQLANDSVAYGQILGFTDTALILWTDAHSFFNPYYMDNQLIMIDSASFRHIFNHSGFAPEWYKKGIFRGTIGGAGIGAAFVIFVGQGWIPFYFALVPTALGTGTGYLIDQRRLKKHTNESEVPINYARFSDIEKEKFTFFPDGFPEAIYYKNGLTHWDSAAFFQLNFNDILAKSPHAKQIFRTRAFSIAGQFVQTLPAFNYRKSGYFDPGFGLSARVNLAKWLYTGYSFRYNHYYNQDYDYLPVVSGFIENYTLNNMNHTLFFQYAPIAPDKFLTNRFEIAAGIGISLNMLDFQLEKFEMFNYLAEFGGEGYEGTHLYSENIDKVSAGLLFLADFGYYLSKAVSLNVNVENSLIRDLETEQKTVTIPRTKESVTFESRKINPSSVRYSFGIRFHF